MRVHHAAGLTQRSASPPSCSSSGLTWQHPAARQALRPPGEGRAAHQRQDNPGNLRWSCTQPPGKRGPGPTAQHSQAVTQDKTNQLQIFEVCGGQEGRSHLPTMRGEAMKLGQGIINLSKRLNSLPGAGSGWGENSYSRHG